MESDGDDTDDDRTPLMARSFRDIRDGSGVYGGTSATSSGGRTQERRRRSRSSGSSGRRVAFAAQHHTSQTNLGDYDVNNPP